MSIQSEISRIQTAKSSIITQIKNKGVSVDANTKIDALPAKIAAIDTPTPISLTFINSLFGKE